MSTLDKLNDLKTTNELTNLLLEYSNLDYEHYLKKLHSLETQGIEIPLACIIGSDFKEKLDGELIQKELKFLISAQFTSDFFEDNNDLNKLFFVGDEIEVKIEDMVFSWKVTKINKYIQRYLYMTDATSKYVTKMRIRIISCGEIRNQFETKLNNPQLLSNLILTKLKESVSYYLPYCFDNFGYIYPDCLPMVKTISQAYQIPINSYTDIALFNESVNLSDFGIKDIALLETLSILIRKREKQVFLYNSQDLACYLKTTRLASLR